MRLQMNLKVLTFLALLVACDYSKPFLESETRHTCSNTIKETERQLEKYLNGIALTKCLSHNFKGTVVIKDTFYCFSKEISTLSDCREALASTECEAYFRCIN